MRKAPPATPCREPSLKKGVGGGDWRLRRLRRLDHGVATALGEDIPGFAEVHFVGFPGGDPH
jgi:hypothetical protein